MRYGRPRMTDLPEDLGRAIFEQILSTPPPDRKKLAEEAHRLEAEMVRIRDREDAKRGIKYEPPPKELNPIERAIKRMLEKKIPIEEIAYYFDEWTEDKIMAFAKNILTTL